LARAKMILREKIELFKNKEFKTLPSAKWTKEKT
jgi:hypothetical protein